MKPTRYHTLLKNLVCLLPLLLMGMHAYTQTVYTAKADGAFSTLSNWINSAGKPLTSRDLDLGPVHFAIKNNTTITFDGTLSIASLSLQTGAKLILQSGSLTVLGDVNINTEKINDVSTIDFGQSNSLLTINGNLNGKEKSLIMHRSTGKFKNELILNGPINTLDAFIKESTGFSFVRYAGASQTVFNSDDYQDLYLEGSGNKVLTSLSSSAQTSTTVSRAFNITKCKLYLGDFDFIYGGQQTSLIYAEGWVVTNKNGLFKNAAMEETLTFPIGDAKNMQAIRFSDIKSPNTKFEVRYGAVNTSNTSIPNGSDVWYVTASQETYVKVTLIEPVASPTLVTTSKISLYDGGWKTQPTDYIARLKEYNADVDLKKSLNSIGILTCPTFTLSSAVLPDAVTGIAYSQDLQVNGTTGRISITNTSSTPAGFSITRGKDISFSNANPGTQDYALRFTVRDTLRCETNSTVSVKIQSIETIWDGKSWSNGEPDASKDVIFKGDYTAKQNESLKAKNVRVDATLILPVSSMLVISGTLINNGKILIECGAILTYNNFRGNSITDNNPIILPESLDPAIAGNSGYNVYFSVNDSPENITLSPIPPNFAFNPAKALLTSIAPKPGTVTFTATYSNNGCVVNKQYTIKIIDLPSPNLILAPIGTKIVDGNAFRLSASSRSNGEISYSIVPAGCATVTEKAGIVSMTCAGTVTVQATQVATDIYKAQTVTQTFTILPAKAKLLIRNFAFVVTENNTIRYTTKSTGAAVSFDQLTGFNTATVDPISGIVIPKASGPFAVRISVEATDNYMAFDSVYTFNVVSLQKPPVALSDTIVLETGKDSTLNILDNDMGMTGTIILDQTDIDIENKGIQVKYYATELGNFIIDAEGNLTVKPFYGFIGSSKIGYTITDVNGLTSEIAYIDVTVKPPFEIPELKANEVMTPNNDNINDALVIANTDINKANSLVIIDEIGNSVYEKINYQNDWEGVDKNENKLEAGVYFYVFKETNTGRQLSKYIQIIK